MQAESPAPYHVCPKNEERRHNLEGTECVCRPDVQDFGVLHHHIMPSTPTCECRTCQLAVLAILSGATDPKRVTWAPHYQAQIEAVRK